MKGTDIDGILTFADPLWPGLIYKTGGAIAQGARIAAGIAANATGKQLVKDIPFFIR
jgi:hypothetical protein